MDVTIFTVEERKLMNDEDETNDFLVEKKRPT
jgi:hypothetical protein